MKTMKKSRFLFIAALSLIMSLSIVGALTVNRKKAFAEETYSISAVPGAQLRITEEGGIRFRFTVDAAAKNYVVGNENVKIQFVVAPKSYFDAGIAETYGLKTFIEDEDANIYASTTEDVFYVNGCIQNVNVKNVALDFQCQARIVEVDGETVKREVASAISEARNLYDVVNKTVLLKDGSYEADILNREKTPYSDWFGTGTYPVQISTAEEYDALKVKCAEGTAFNNVAVAVDGDVTVSDSDFPEVNKPSIDIMRTVTFMNGSDVYATVKVKNGQSAAAPAINPRKAADSAFSYTFNGWDGEFTNVTEDITVTANYTGALIFDNASALAEIAEWEKVGATKIVSALNSDASVYAFGENNVYKAHKNDNNSVAAGSDKITPSDYKTLYLAYMTTKQVGLAHSGGSNQNKANTWYFVKYEKQSDGSWTLSVKQVGATGEYSALEVQTNSDTGKPNCLYAGAPFATMFNTYIWATDKNLDMYATDVWGVTAENAEIAEWEKAGATKIASALKATAVPAEEKFGSHNVYTTSNVSNGDIANETIAISAYKELYFAYKTNKSVKLSNGGANDNVANTWYFVRLAKQSDNGWNISAKKVGEESYTSLTADPQFFGAGKASFVTMFRTYDWGDSHNVYATDVWGVEDGAFKNEFAEWEKAGATNLGSALNSSDAVYTLGGNNVYKVSSGGTDSIANTGIAVSEYSTLYLAFMTTKQVSLTHGGGANSNVANTWYFVKYEKQDDGSWLLSAKKLGGTDYTELTNANSNDLTANSKFDVMFKTYLWNAGGYDVYATDVWGVK